MIMVLICSKCEARLQLDEAKAPSRPFTVRCPKCQTSVNVQPPPPALSDAAPSETVNRPETRTAADRISFERPVTASLFKSNSEDSNATTTQSASAELNDLAKLSAEAMRQTDSGSSTSLGKRHACDRREV